MPVINLIAVGLPIALGVVMIGTGAVNFAGPSLARENFALWGYPAGFHRVAGSLGVVVGLLAMIPATARVGAIGSPIFMLAAVATLIRSRDWGRLPVAAVLTAACIAAIAIHG
ncbi:DoxX-like protein [Roseiarcus fermentans]|uniref:DoxX-like protein n=1 Tax=Roseiarcus fermentans TaxID=1473586 RepID=A0A366FMC0_9HYPH|nr:DoxX family protein [Roseiarcus fermentans]RBP15792.1 DoxX-like protein [Roseiarcus fermentans]